MGQKAAQQPNGAWMLTDGTLLTADVVYQTIGGGPNTQFLRGLDILDAKGAIKVVPYMIKFSVHLTLSLEVSG